jgi:hypothetical protein
MSTESRQLLLGIDPVEAALARWTRSTAIYPIIWHVASIIRFPVRILVSLEADPQYRTPREGWPVTISVARWFYTDEESPFLHRMGGVSYRFKAHRREFACDWLSAVEYAERLEAIAARRVAKEGWMVSVR